MENGVQVICMQHCSSQKNIFFSSFPKVCPICGTDLKNCSLLVPPFKVPSPFVSGHDTPFSVLLRPTTGSFLSEYKGADDLHIGVSNSQGLVYNFDENGVHQDSSGWNQCISIDISFITGMPSTYTLNHNEVLNDMSASGKWTGQSYDEQENNCFSFVLAFINSLLGPDHQLKNKAEFTQLYLCPSTSKVAKYIEIFKGVQKHGSVAISCKTQESPIL